jgi:membrane-bound serine protease (ClpP class)
MILLTGIVVAFLFVPEGWRIPVIVAFAVLEATETLVTWRLSRRGAPKVGAETLIGAGGRTLTECRPSGTVRVRGEVWQARCETGAAVGQAVRVTGRDGLTLVVERIER